MNERPVPQRHRAAARAIALELPAASSPPERISFRPFRSLASLQPLRDWLRWYGAVLLFLAIWESASQFALVDPAVIPPLTSVAAAMVEGFRDGELLGNVLVSLGRSGLAFGLAVVIAVPLGLLMGSFRRFEELVDSLLQLFRQTAALAIYPIFILLLGLGETSKVAIIMWGAFFPILLNTISGVKLVDRRLVEMALVFGASRTDVFMRVVLPAATPAIFVGLRLSATISLLLLVAAEMIGAKKGLGFLIINAQYNFEIPLMFAAIVLLALIGLAVNYVLVLLQHRLCRWERPERSKSCGRPGSKRYRTATATALVVALVLSPIGIARARAEGAGEVTAIRYLQSSGNVTPFELAEAKGWFAEKGIKLAPQGFVQGGPEALVALASGSVDLAGAATAAVINAVAGGAKIVGIGPGAGVSKAVNSKFYVLADSDAKAPADLKDKSIAVNTLGAHLDYTVREYLRRNGLKLSDVKLVMVPGPQLEQVLRHKQVDIAAVGAWQTVFAGKLESAGGVRVLFTDYDVLGDIVLGNTVMPRSFIEQHPQAVKDFATASARAVDWSEEHRDEAKSLVGAILKNRGENPTLAEYWKGFGLRQHALYTDYDGRFWIDVLVRAGKIKQGQFAPEDIETNKYNEFSHLAQQ